MKITRKKFLVFNTISPMLIFNKIVSLFILLVCVTLCLVSCDKKQKRSEPQIGLNNYYLTPGTDLTTDYKRIASVSPQVTEMLCALGCKDRLLCRTDFCNFPKDIKNITSVGGINNADVEKIISLHPDIVICSSIFTKRMVQMLEDASLSVLSFKEGNKIEDMYSVMTILGKITSKEAIADSLIADCKKRLEIVSNNCKQILKTTKSDKPKVYYVVGFGSGGDFSAGEDTYINEIFTLAGADNIAKNAKNWSFNKEELFKNQPEYIFVRSEDKETFKRTHPYSELKAVKNNKVIGIDDLDTQTPRSIDAIEFIFKTIYKIK